MQDVQRLEDPDEIRDALQLVGVQDPPPRAPLHLIIGAIGDASQELASVFIAYLPAVDQLEEGLQRRAAQPLALAPLLQVDERRGIVAGGGIAVGRLFHVS